MTEPNNSDLKGLGGWLILVGIGVVINPIRLVIIGVLSYKPLFESGAWEQITTVGSGFYNPYLSYLLIGELVFNVTILLAAIYLVYLFFSRHYLFPKVYISVVVVSLVFIVTDAWLVSIIIPDTPLFDTETVAEFIRVLITASIWIPYMLVSKRVRVTFVEKLPDKNTLPHKDT